MNTSPDIAPPRAVTVRSRLLPLLGFLPLLATAALAQAPLIFTHTKAALPGQVMVIHGARFIQGDQHPQVWFDAISGSADTPNPEFKSDEILSKTDKLLHVRVPSNLPVGLYAVFVRCGTNTSSHVWVNRAETWNTLDIASAEIDPGRTFRLYGWNMDLTGATPQVWFENTATSVRTAATVTNADRANFLTLTSPASLTPGQNYRLIVSNGYGGTYGETAGPVLACLATPADPLGLDVPWAGEFAFASTTIINAKNPPYNAVGDGVADDRAALQAACNAATAAGGGQVYLPAGTYRLGANLKPKSRVLLRGAGKDLTTLLGSVTPDYVHSTHGTTFHNGAMDLSISNGQMRWNSFSPAGGPVVVVRCRIDTTGSNALDLAGLNTKTLVRDCELIARHRFTGNVLNAVGANQVIIKNTYVQWSDGRIAAWNGHNIQFDGCTFVRATDTADDNGAIGFGGIEASGRKDIAIIDSVFGKTGSGVLLQQNDGETILNQSVPRLGAGFATAATSATLTDTARTWTANALATQNAWAVIVGGTGEGQWRKITANTTDTVTVDTPWDITPSTDSAYAITWQDNHWLIAGNTFQNCPRATWFYSCTMTDVAVVDNDYIDSADLYLRAEQRRSDGQGRFSLFRNVLIEGNELLNTDHVYPTQLSLQATIPSAGPEARIGNAFWDVVVRGNIVDSIRPSLTTNNAYGVAGEGYFAIGTGYGAGMNGAEGVKGALFDRNASYNVDKAYHTATGAARTTIYRPELVNVGTPVSDTLLSGATLGATRTTHIPEDLVEVILDNTAASGVTLTGAWSVSGGTTGYYGSNYITDGNSGKGAKSVLYAPNLPSAGTYAVYIQWTAGTNRSAAVPVTVTHTGGTAGHTVNQKLNGSEWQLLGAYAFNAGTGGTVLISNTGTAGYVLADAVRFVKQ